MIHDIFDLISAAAAFVWLVIGLLMKANMSDIKTIIAEIRGIINSHIAVDEEIHDSVDRRLNRIEGRFK